MTVPRTIARLRAHTTLLALVAAALALEAGKRWC
jgi:hypothetical protein